MKTTIIAACLCLVQIVTLFAQGKEISEKDMQAIQAEMKSISDKIEVTIKKDEKLYSAMKEEIEILNKIKDLKARGLAIEKYKTKYSTQYGQVLAKAGINMKNIVSDWNLKYKNYSFKLNNGYAVSLTAKANPPAGGYALPNTPTTTITPIKDFLQNQEISCGLIGFNDVKFEEKSISTSSTGVVAGGCGARGTLTKQIPNPGDAKSVVLKLDGRLEVSCYAVGIAGISFSGGYAICNTESLFLSVGAPFLWVGSSSDFEDFSIESPYDKKEEIIYIDMAASSSSASVLCCATSGSSKVSLTKAELIVTK